MVEPTPEGKKRYEPDGYYTLNAFDGELGTPCTCHETCPPNCKGQCGCKACAEAYSDFLSDE